MLPRFANMIFIFAISTLCLCNPTVLAQQTQGGTGVEITNLGEKLRVEINGKLFTEYHFKDVPRPYFYPVIGPTGEPVTRNWPMKEAENEQHDHPHHRSLWFTHGDVNGHDF